MIGVYIPHTFQLCLLQKCARKYAWKSKEIGKLCAFPPSSFDPTLFPLPRNPLFFLISSFSPSQIIQTPSFPLLSPPFICMMKAFCLLFEKRGVESHVGQSAFQFIKYIFYEKYAKKGSTACGRQAWPQL